MAEFITRFPVLFAMLLMLAVLLAFSIVALCVGKNSKNKASKDDHAFVIGSLLAEMEKDRNVVAIHVRREGETLVVKNVIKDERKGGK